MRSPLTIDLDSWICKTPEVTSTTLLMKIQSITLILLMIAVIGVFLSFVPFIYDKDVSASANHSRRAPMIMGETAENIFWFIQVSDIHISKFYGPARAPDLLRFCKEHLPTILPDFVIASGDLTDAKHLDGRGSKQYIEEWQIYKDIVSQCRNIHNVQWLDVRGNHDAFNVPSADDQNNLFRRFSVQGPRHPSSYVYHHSKPWGKYSFIAMDACPDPGPRRPFNFFGYVNKKQVEKLKLHIQSTKDSNMTVWFGHYPTSLILTENITGVRNLMRNAVAYMCGHLHTLGHIVPNLYARHRSGTLELELGDWRDERRYRIVAVDHDTLTLTDETLGEWPIILITNPKNVLYTSNKEPEDTISMSTHIRQVNWHPVDQELWSVYSDVSLDRLLVFSPHDITTVRVYIDNELIGDASQVSGPLFVLPWEPNKYDGGLHSIKVVVQDSTFKEKQTLHWFAVDGTKSDFPVLPSLILLTNIYVLGKLLFWFMMCSHIGILLLLRNCTNIKTVFLKNVPFLPKSLVHFLNNWLLRLWLVSKTSVLFYSLNFFILYVAVGPWFVAEIIEGHTGVMFIWGLYIKDTVLPGSLSYFYGIFHIITFNVPLLMFLGYTIQYLQCQKHSKLVRSGTVWHQIRHIYIPFLALLLLNGFIAFKEFPAAYGSRAMILGPVRTGSILLAIVLFLKARNHALNIPYISTRC